MPALAPPVIEVVRRRPVLGLRFRDDVTGEVVRDVRVRLTMPGRSGPALPVVTPSGVYAWRSLPGFGAWALDGEAGAVPRVAADVTVEDPQGRYLAYHFAVTLPLAGIATVTCGSPPEPVGSPVESPPELAGHDGAALPLFSLPGRAAPASTGVVRAALLHRDDRTPAAYATLSLVTEAGDKALGVADERGQVVVFVPYPKPARSPGSVPSGSAPVGSGPLGSRQPVTSMTWDLTLLAGVPRRRPVDPLPDLCDLLDQDSARLTTTEAGLTLTRASLTYGRELVLPNDGPRRELLVGP